MRNHLLNKICKFYFISKESEKTLFFSALIFLRIKKYHDDDDVSSSSIDVIVTPSTPTVLSSTLGALEPPITPTFNEFSVPTVNTNWNQISEVELSDGRKVFFLLK